MISENEYIFKQDSFVAGTSYEPPVSERTDCSHETEPNASTSLSYDPFQIFEVNPQKCHIVIVTVLDGLYTPSRWVLNLLHLPSLSVILDIPNTPNSQKRTNGVASKNPVWNETFTFLIDPECENILLIDVVETRLFRSDAQVGKAEVDLNELPLDSEADAEFELKEGSKICFKLTRIEDSKPDLRLSLDLPNDEIEFLKKRRKHAFEAMKRFLPAGDAPENDSEVPTIGVLGSGGGFRALIGLSGAMKALDKSGALDCVTYLASLSGASWYISFLYAQPDFPVKGPGDFQEKLKANICKNNWLKLITPTRMYSYISPVLQKSKIGQPVSLTDFFGHLIGDTILTELKDCTKLSDQAEKLNQGQAPLPLYTCINVKKQVSARVFQDWLEFSPYEIGFAKYGFFMKTQHFGSKFFMGKLLLEYDEQPLHYLQGLWGSAFSILFKRLLQEKELRKTVSELPLGKLSEEELLNDEESMLNSYFPDEDNVADIMHTDSCTSSDDECYDTSLKITNKDSAYSIHSSCQSSERNVKLRIKPSVTSTKIKPTATVGNVQMHRSKTWTALPTPNVQRHALMKKKSISKDKIGKSFWEKTLDNLIKSNIMNTRVGRAGLIFNPMRGLKFKHMYSSSPFNPTTPEDVEAFKGYLEPTEIQAKKLFLVDAGLTFNLPFPLLMRPQRGVEIYLTFDFSFRPSDMSSPFRELLLVEKWAKLNEVSFPPIKEQVDMFENEALRECYLFENQKDPYCPILLHFILLNKKFKTFKSPGVQRTTQEEIEEANFAVFSDPKSSFSVFNFAYTQAQYDQLIHLMEFNTLESIPLIKEQIARAVSRKRNLKKSPLSD